MVQFSSDNSELRGDTYDSEDRTINSDLARDCVAIDDLPDLLQGQYRHGVINGPRVLLLSDE